ncbi:echinoderm microtubule-associated protein-like 4 isoform X2 [Lingula anatina]|uniref:Echinoderm microtubule-associated protein-like 4 isoform X2 n=1 Tax=Lingula anatina TaxID=7574 RepID=A0A1S3JXG1_LINAN|nr:echinoderm microtubule-associated protein-like 4 isoform X2 [Lingula anatina]|eukprot:XP_013415115.1 echinoderm microtubule-associated protein-like 4 isoform X2 [Lingula anatina]
MMDLECEELEVFEDAYVDTATMSQNKSQSGHSRLRTVARTGGILNLNTSLNSTLNSSDGSQAWNEMKRSNSQSAKTRRTPRATELSLGGNSIASFSAFQEEEDRGKVTEEDPEIHLHSMLRGPLKECSRQRLRAVQMSLRKYGSNVESRVTSKELFQVLQENNLKIPNRVFQMLVERFTDQKGIDFEKLYKCLVTAQSKTGRDSVIAINTRNDLDVDKCQSQLTQEEKDADLLRRLEEQMERGGEYFDAEELKQSFQTQDSNRTGKIAKKQMLEICLNHQIPIYGALLNGIMNRCDDEKNEMISWPEMISFLERSWQNLVEKKPQVLKRPQTSLSQSMSSMSHTVSFTMGEDALNSSANEVQTPVNAQPPPALPVIPEQAPPPPAAPPPPPLTSTPRPSALPTHTLAMLPEHAESSPAEAVSSPENTLPISHHSQASMDFNTSQTSQQMQSQLNMSGNSSAGDTSSQVSQQTQSQPKTIEAQPAVDPKSENVSQVSTKADPLPHRQNNESTEKRGPSFEVIPDINEICKWFESETKANNQSIKTPQKKEAHAQAQNEQETAKKLMSVRSDDASGKENTQSDYCTVVDLSDKNQLNASESIKVNDSKSRSNSAQLPKKQAFTEAEQDKAKDTPNRKKSLPAYTASTSKSSSSKNSKRPKSSTNRRTERRGSDDFTAPTLSSKNKSIRKIHSASTHSSQPNLKETPTSRETTSAKKEGRNSKFKKTTAPVQTASGFLSSVKNKLTGRNSQIGMGEEIQSDRPVTSHTIHEEEQGCNEDTSDGQNAATSTDLHAEVSSPPPPPVQAEDNTEIVMNIKGKDTKLYIPDVYLGKQHAIDPPKERLKLEWVYGYRGNDCRSNIHITSAGEILYFVGPISVLYNNESHSQRHYREHTEDIKCMALHSNGVTVATGQESSKQENNAHIRIWRCDTLQTLHVCGMGFFEKSVVCMAFTRIKKSHGDSMDSNSQFKIQDRLVAVDDSAEHVMSIWDVSLGKRLAHVLIGVDVICDVGFNPRDPAILVTIGREHIAWWKAYVEGGMIEMNGNPNYEKHNKARFIICMMHNDKGDLVTGDSNGTIYVWGYGGNVITNYIKHAHEGPVFSLLSLRGTLLSGGRDGKLCAWAWNKNMDTAGEMKLPRTEGGLRMIQVCGDRLLCGTTMNAIVSAKMASQGPPLSDLTPEPIPLTQGHFDDLRGLSVVHNSEHSGWFLTAGYDGILCLFDAQTRRGLWKAYLKNTHVTCVDVSHSGNLLTLGTKDGGVILLEFSSSMNLNEQHRIKLNKHRIDKIAFAPDCSMIAVASHNSPLHLIQVDVNEMMNRQLEVVGEFKGHMSSITGLDWSVEKVEGSWILRSSCCDHTAKFWDTNLLQEITEIKTLRNVDWGSMQCTLDYTVAGVWKSKQAQEADIMSLDVNAATNILVMGDGSGRLSLFRHPCSQDGGFSHTYRAHRCVYGVKFTADNSHVISVGGRDTCVLQWKII